MFEKRIKGLIGVLGVALLIVVIRLVQLQLFQADYYRQQAARSVLLKPRSLPFVRGGIFDRSGEVLVRDEPCWDLRMDYDVIAAQFEAEQTTINRVIRKFRRSHRYPGAHSDEQIDLAFMHELNEMWNKLSAFAINQLLDTQSDLRDHANKIYLKISRVHKVVARRRGFDAPIREERLAQIIFSGLNADQQILAREQFASYPWIHVMPSSVRRYSDHTESFSHLLGRMGRVDEKVVENDPHSQDPFAKYLANEFLGTTGVEWLAESRLRGRRGQITLDRDGVMVMEKDIEALHGEDIQLTIHAPLQRRLYQLLEQTVLDVADSTGGAIVVLDVQSREALAMVSYPGYDPNLFDEIYSELRDDTERLPLRFRAVSSRYAPGSTIKPLICLAGLMNDVISLDTRETCTGYLFEEHRDRWRCWQMHGTQQRKAHGSIDVVEALTGSCNVFMYRLGERLGIDRLCSIFDMVGIGRGSGIGLREENFGINPTPGWLMAHKNAPVTRGSSRLFAIGQGEISMTPLQVANLMATYASGRYRHVQIIKQSEDTPEWTLPGKPEHWHAIRRGMYGVMNDISGTAYHFAHFEHDRYTLVGKTGSATAHPWPTMYRIPFTDETGTRVYAMIKAGAKARAIERFLRNDPEVEFDPKQVEVARRWPIHPPASGEKHAHAWVGGFLQPLDRNHQPDWFAQPRLAFAVIVEFGGSGGRVSGPLAKKVAQELIDMFGPDLDIDAPTQVSEHFVPDSINMVSEIP